MIMHMPTLANVESMNNYLTNYLFIIARTEVNKNIENKETTKEFFLILTI